MRKPLKGITYVVSMCRSMNECVTFHHYQIKMKPPHVMQATKIACGAVDYMKKFWYDVITA